MSTKTKIAKAYLVLVAASILGHGLSMVKEMLIAGYFGVSKVMDSYYAALTIPNLVSAIVLSPFVLIFVPIFIKHKLADKEAANRLVSIVSNLTLLVLFGASLVIFALAGTVIKFASPGLDAQTAASAATVLRIISFSMFFAGVANLLTGILNAFEHFFWPAVSGMFITLSTIFLILGFANEWGVFVVGWGLLIGTALQALFLVPVARKHGFRYHKALELGHPDIQRFLNLAFILSLIGLVAGLTGVTNRFMASWLPGGSIAGLAYADKLVQVPLIIFSGSIASAIYPFVAAQAAGDQLPELKDTVSTSIRMAGFIFIPMAVIMMILARPAIQLVFQRGAFDAAATDLTSSIFVFYTLQLFSIYVIVILQRVLFAFHCLKSIFKITAVTVVLNLVFNLIFMKLLDPPACGIALSTSVVSFLAAIMYFITLKKRVQNLHGLAILKSLARITAISLVAGLAVFLAYRGLYDAAYVTIPYQIMNLAAASSAGLAVFLLISAAFRLEEFQKTYLLFKTKFS
ncbi:MAG: virulence factor [Elusimicrobia bacterium]|nr:MAG: virulence factor [Elusimicrobiota bacterium]KAF0153731.1 MAG: virulence factor [Elusimicrobiota bacterium]